MNYLRLEEVNSTWICSPSYVLWPAPPHTSAHLWSVPGVSSPAPCDSSPASLWSSWTHPTLVQKSWNDRGGWREVEEEVRHLSDQPKRDFTPHTLCRGSVVCLDSPELRKVSCWLGKFGHGPGIRLLNGAPEEDIKMYVILDFSTSAAEELCFCFHSAQINTKSEQTS